MSWIVLDETRVWFNNVEITPYLRTGRDPVTVVDGRVVFAATGHPWTPPELNRRADEHTEVCR